MINKNLSSIEEKELVKGFKGKIIHSDSMTFAYWNIDINSQLPEHSHPHEQVANILEGKFEITVDGETKTGGPGDVIVIPPNTVHSGQALTRCRILDVFSPVREDYK